MISRNSIEEELLCKYAKLLITEHRLINIMIYCP